MSLMNQDREFLWIHKYRGRTLAEVVLPESMMDELTTYVEKKILPSLLLVSPSPGTGKTTTAVAFAGDAGCKRPLIINASKDTDIGTIRTTVQQYATGASLTMRGMPKVVILDEVDRLSDAAQEALKGIIEDVSHNCSFILTTNHEYRISEHLRSRCNRLDFVFTDQDRIKCAAGIMKRGIEILEAEGVKYDKRVVMELVKKLVPDNRSFIKTLQQAYMRYGEINVAILSDLDGCGVDGLMEPLRKQAYGEILQWVTDNHANVGSNFFRRLYDNLRPELEPACIPGVIVLIHEEMKDFRNTSDTMMYLNGFLTLLLGEIKFKE